MSSNANARAPWLGLLIAAACGDVRAVTDASIDGPPADAAPADAAPVTDRNCVDLKARLATAVDGVYPIDPDGTGALYKPFEVFCRDMATATPKEYLELKRTTLPSEQPSSNYATYFAGPAHLDFMCPCGVLTMVFSKIRINPVMLLTDIEDRTYAVFTSTTNVTCWQNTAGCRTPSHVVVPRYALAQSCVTPGDSSGRANVDLRDIPFHVAGTDTSMFMGVGSGPNGTVTIDDERKQVTLTGGGDCGGFGAGPGLRLAQDF